MFNAYGGFDITFYEAFAEEEQELRRFLPPACRASFTWQTVQESGDAAPPADIISIRTQSRIPPAWVSRLRGIITRSTGYDHIQAWRKNVQIEIPAAYLPEYAARAVAEQAMLLWSALLRHLPEQQKAFAKFARDGLTGRELRGRRITVLGVGRIGSQIVDIAHALGMDVAGIDLIENPELKASYGLKYLPLEEGIARADVLAVALPLTELTRGILDRETLSGIPAGAILVNVGRGESTPPKVLRELLETGQLGGIGLDVYDCEVELSGVLRDGRSPADIPEPERSTTLDLLALKENPRVIFTPHNAFNTAEAVTRKSEETVRNLRHFMQHGKFLTPIPEIPSR